jgi:cardiolipin synthase
VIRDNLRHRRDIESAYLAAIRTAKEEIPIANAYFFRDPHPSRADLGGRARGPGRCSAGHVEFALPHCAPRPRWPTAAAPASRNHLSFPARESP